MISFRRIDALISCENVWKEIFLKTKNNHVDPHIEAVFFHDNTCVEGCHAWVKNWNLSFPREKKLHRRAPHIFVLGEAYIYRYQRYGHVWKFHFWEICSFLPASWGGPILLDIGARRRKGTPLTIIVFGGYTYKSSSYGNLIIYLLCRHNFPYKYSIDSDFVNQILIFLIEMFLRITQPAVCLLKYPNQIKDNEHFMTGTAV